MKRHWFYTMYVPNRKNWNIMVKCFKNEYSYRIRITDLEYGEWNEYFTNESDFVKRLIEIKETNK